MLITHFLLLVVASKLLAPTADHRAILKSAVVDQAEKQLGEALLLRQKLTQHDLTSAIGLFRKSASQFRASGLPLKAAQAEREAGDTYLMSSRYTEASAAYERALSLAGDDSEARCSALGRMARLQSSIGNSVDAERESKQALRICREHSSKHTLADVFEAEGETIFWSGKWNESVASLSRARDLYEDVHDVEGQASALLILAYARGNGNREVALGFARKALRLWSSLGNAYGVAKARLALSLFASLSGEFEFAQCGCEDALRTFQGVGDADNEAIAGNILGKVTREMGDPQRSLASYRLARTRAAVVHDTLTEAEAITGMSEALIAMRRRGQLASLYEDKLRLARRARHSVLLASGLADMAAMNQWEGHDSAAESLYRRAIAIYRAKESAYREGDVLFNLGSLQVRQGRDADAIATFKESLQIKEAKSQGGDVAKVYYELARIYRRMDRPEEALQAISNTIEMVESHKLQVTDFDSRASYFASLHQYYSLYVQVLMLLDPRFPAMGFAQRAFEVAERSKVRSFMDLLASSGRTAPCSKLLGEEPDAAPDAGVENEMAWPLTLSEVQAETGDEHNILVEYVLGDEKSYAWVVDRDQMIVYELPAAESIRRLVHGFRTSLVPPQPGPTETALEYRARAQQAERDYQRYSRELAATLIGRLALPGNKRILMVPDGFLQSIPFSTLPLPQKEERGTLLLNRHEVVVLPSASALKALRARSAMREAPSSGVAVFADPVFSRPILPIPAISKPISRNSSTAEICSEFLAPVQRGSGQEHSRALTMALRDTQGSDRVPSLPGSCAEARAIREAVGPQNAHLALRFEANRQSVVEGQLNRYSVVHFATHGILDAQHPEMSGLILSLFNANGRAQDGYLRLGDIYRLRLSADLVVLSACQSGLGKELESEGIIGLPRGFLFAGARSVIATLWKVDDGASAALMRDFYRLLGEGKRPGQALQLAQQNMVKGGTYADPFYWAAFVLQGDYESKPILNRSKPIN